MKVLLVAATHQEVEPLLERLAWDDILQPFKYGELQLELVISGVGMIATAFTLSQKIEEGKYDLAINLGIAGSFNPQLELGEVVEVISDQLAEEGAENGAQFLDLNELGLRANNEFPFEGGELKASKINFELELKKVKGITVNTVHGNEPSIQAIVKRLNPEAESMEGAAFFYVCKRLNLACLQIRAISNYVEKRNRSNWKIELALDNLALKMQALLKQL